MNAYGNLECCSLHAEPWICQDLLTWCIVGTAADQVQIELIICVNVFLSFARVDILYTMLHACQGLWESVCFWAEFPGMANAQWLAMGQAFFWSGPKVSKEDTPIKMEARLFRASEWFAPHCLKEKQHKNSYWILNKKINVKATSKHIWRFPGGLCLGFFRVLAGFLTSLVPFVCSFLICILGAFGCSSQDFERWERADDLTTCAGVHETC